MTEADFITLSQFSLSVNLNFTAHHFCCITHQSMVLSTRLHVTLLLTFRPSCALQLLLVHTIIIIHDLLFLPISTIESTVS